MPLTPGQTILNKYHLLKLIGEGGMARVWLAEEITFGNRQVAIKEPRSDLLPEDQEEVRRRYHREVQVCAALEQAGTPHIVRALTAEPYNDGLLLVMAYLPGGDLAGLLKEHPTGLPIDRTVAITLDVLRALQGAHEHPLEIVHRDVKPSNILFDAGDKAHLGDFGLAQLAGASGRSQLRGGQHPGTPLYMAPEQATSQDYLTPAADLYALGCVLFEMLSGKRYKRRRPGTPASRLREEVPAWLDEALARALAEDPWNRWESAQEMAEALEAALQQWKIETLFSPEVQAEVIEGEPTVVREWRQLSLPTQVAVLRPENAAQATELGQLGLGRIGCAACSPDGRLLAVGTSQGIELRDARNLRLLRTQADYTAWVGSVIFSPDGRILASGSNDKTVRLWRMSDRTLLHILKGHTSAVWSVAFSPDGQTLASGSYDKTVRLWRVSDGALLHTLEGHQDWVHSVAFSPDGRTLASASGGPSYYFYHNQGDYTVRLWRVSDGAFLHILKGHTDEVNSVAFSPDGRILASGSFDKTVRLWRMSDGTLLRTLEHQDWVTSVAFSPDGTTLASGSKDTVRLWRVGDGAPLRTLEHQSWARVSFSPDGALLISEETREVRLWRASNGSLLRTLQRRTSGEGGVAFSPDGQTMASGSGNGKVYLWRMSNGTLLHTLKGHTDKVNSVAFSPDGQTLASGSDDKTVRLWRVSDGTLLRTLEKHTSGVESVAFSPDGRTLALGSSHVRLWRVGEGSLLRTFKGHMHLVESVAFSLDGRILASGSFDKTVRLWRVSDGTPLGTLEGHTGPVRSVAFNPNGQTLASGSDDETVRLWRMSDGTPLRTLEGHTAWVRSVAFSPDGQLLASGSNDTTVRLWQMSDGTPLRTLEGHTAWVRSVAFSPDGQALASGSNDGTVQLWGVRD